MRSFNYMIPEIMRDTVEMYEHADITGLFSP